MQLSKNSLFIILLS